MVEAAESASLSRNTPYAGMELPGRVVATFLRGRPTVLDETEVERVVMSVDGVLGCHHIRTRGSADFVFLDLHIWMDAAMPLHHAHELSHVVKDKLMARFPQIKDAIIHIEPPPRESQQSAVDS